MSDARFVHALALGIDPAWRRLPADERRRGFEELATVLGEASAVTTFTYSSIGIEAGADLLLWSLAPSLEALEERVAAALRTSLGGWLTVRESFVGVIQQSQYVKKPTPQEQSLFSGERSHYLVVYPFTKGTDWYLLGKEARQGIMNEHMRIGHDYPEIRQLLANSFGVDDMDFLVAYETDDLAHFGELVRALRGTDSRRSTVRDTPLLVGVHRPLPEIAALLGAR
ncbi:MAG TPA: chlorite dismutase family protein [Candidatus Dormibacteraeota bacterium]|nr:chlorite dismutase family protein [Candidatus Dormibacteraeota bacterium]